MEVCVYFLPCFSFSNAQILYCCYSRKLNFYLYYTCGLPPHRNIYAHNNPPVMYSASHTKYSFRSSSSCSWNITSNFHATKVHHSIHNIPLLTTLYQWNLVHTSMFKL